MRMLIRVTLPHEPFNKLVRNGTVGQKINEILEELKPQAVYFTELRGQRTAVIIADLSDASKIPVIAEPWFLTFNADVEFHPVMLPDDLMKSGLDTLGKKWG
jgi:hypothetical protein